MFTNLTFQQEKELDDLEFDEEADDDETEREAIELIQKQMREIQELKSALGEKET
jgi:hypothetical protein